MHLQQSTHKQEQGPSFLITPHTVDKVIDGEVWPTTFSNNISFYLWQEGQKDVSLVRSMDFHGEFGTVYPMSHCDGLVLISTDTKVYVLNPAIGDVLELPDGHKDVGEFQTVGLGLDPRTEKYKVVRSFYRSKDSSKRAYDAGMEVFTIGGDDFNMCWRSTVNDPPYPILPQGDPKCLRGSIYWELYKRLLESPPQGVVKFSLEDETFSLIHYPSMQSEKDTAHLIVLGGELCLAQSLATAQIVIWRSSSSTDCHHWSKIYTINLFEAWTFHPLLGTHTDGILVRRGNYLYRCDESSRFAREVLCVHQVNKNAKAGSFSYGAEDVFYYNIIPYAESLVRVTKGKLPAAVCS
jgi:F-box interacting protein